MSGVAIIFCLLFFFAGAYAQEQDTPLGLSSRFSRQNNVTWLSNHDLSYKFSRNKYRFDFRVHHDNIYNSSVAEDRFFQFYFNSSFWQHYRLGSKLELSSWVETDQFLNLRNEKYCFYGGISWVPIATVRITPLIGYAFDRRDQFLDMGFTPAILLDIDHSWKNDLRVFTRSMFRYKRIDPRQQRNATLDHYWSKKFSGKNRITAGLKASSHELDNYLNNSVQRIVSDTIQPELKIGYEFMKGLIWTSENSGTLFQRFFRYRSLVPAQAEFNDITYSGLDFRSFQQLSFSSEKLKILGFYEYRYQNRFYEVENSRNDPEAVFQNQMDREKGKDFLRNIHKLEFNSVLNLARRHQLSGKYTAQYLQYDTPGLNNFDDRDELSYVSVAGLRTRWTSAFMTNMRLMGNYRHLAFLFKEKSQDNYIQRSLRFDFEYAWDIHPKVRLEGTNAVYVTYNVKDFDDFNLTDRSSRNIETNFRLVTHPAPKVTSRFAFNRKTNHQSYFNWNAFTETTLDTTSFTVIEQINQVEFRVGRCESVLSLEAGLKHYRQGKRFQSAMYDESGNLVPIFLRQINMQTGPITNAGYRNSKNLSFQLQTWWQLQIGKNRFDEGGSLVTITSPKSEKDLQLIETKLRPFVQFGLSWVWVETIKK